MAEEEKTKKSVDSGTLKTILVIGGVALVGWGGYMLVSRLADIEKAKDERYMEIWREYLDEVVECDNFYAELVEKGSIPRTAGKSRKVVDLRDVYSKDEKTKK